MCTQCVLCFLYVSLHEALITRCLVFLSLCPLFLCVSVILFFAALRIFVSMCVCDLCVSSWILVSGDMYKVIFQESSKPISKSVLFL